MARNRKANTPIDSIRHDERRTNIPTEEQRGFVAGDEAAPPSMLYPRDPSLDPQLVWQGKDAQDRDGLSVPVVPVYIQEKIHPEAIIEDFVRHARKAVDGQIGDESPYYQLNMFADFNGFDEDTPGKRLDFYSHDDGSRPHWSNRMILGDSLLVMNSLAEKEGLKGRVQMIYIDPPYGIKFGSNWQVSTRKRDVKDNKVGDLTRQPEQVKAFRDTWQLGINSYLSYLRDRLVTSRELLTEVGSVFVQIGDENVHLVRNLLDEVFGSENFVSIMSVRKTGGTTGALLQGTVDFVLWYAKDKERCKFRPIYRERTIQEAYESGYTNLDIDNEIRRRASVDDVNEVAISSNLRLWLNQILTSPRIRESRSGYFPIEFEGRRYLPTSGEWKTNASGIERLKIANRISSNGKTLGYVRFADDFPAITINNLWADLWGATSPIYVVQTNTRVVERCMHMTTDPGDLVLDPTCGSGTTATVAEQWGRRWITIDTSRVALALARTRLMSARYPWYHLAADHPDLPPTATDAEIKAHLKNPQMHADARRYEENNLRSSSLSADQSSSSNPQMHADTRRYEERRDKEQNLHLRPSASSSADKNSYSDIRRGFVYRRVPHITLKSIANNPEIDAIHDTWQPQLDALRAEINRAAGKKWEEWEVPRDTRYEIRDTSSEAVGGRPSAVAPLLARWWGLRRERQAEIDEAIGRHADTETLYDQPYEDNKRLRVAGPFTVESLSPHRTLDPQMDADGRRLEEKNLHLRKSASSSADKSSSSSSDFTATILDYLRRTPVQNTRKGERLKLERLEVYPGRWLNAAGEYTDAAGETRRAAVFIGPEHNAVSPQMIHEAAKEAVRGLGFDVLLVCGFAFDPHANEEASRYSRPVVLNVHMNPDLMMGDELLKKTGAGNLFMIFGEPDIRKETDADGRVIVELLGVDIYDPTTGEVRSSGPDDIACWFIDTDYDEESFFVRHAYFTGADEPYDKLKRALRAEVDEAAWAELYRTRSRPFDRPESGRIAVKVINHYGDEVLKVFEV